MYKPRLRSIEGILPIATNEMMDSFYLLPGRDNNLCLYLGKMYMRV